MGKSRIPGTLDRPVFLWRLLGPDSSLSSSPVRGRFRVGPGTTGTFSFPVADEILLHSFVRPDSVPLTKGSREADEDMNQQQRQIMAYASLTCVRSRHIWMDDGCAENTPVLDDGRTRHCRAPTFPGRRLCRAAPVLGVFSTWSLCTRSAADNKTGGIASGGR